MFKRHRLDMAAIGDFGLKLVLYVTDMLREYMLKGRIRCVNFQNDINFPPTANRQSIIFTHRTTNHG